jgi:hypothetical protein
LMKKLLDFFQSLEVNEIRLSGFFLLIHQEFRTGTQ